MGQVLWVPWSMGPRRTHILARVTPGVSAHEVGTWISVWICSGSTRWGRVWVGPLEELFLYIVSKIAL